MCKYGQVTNLDVHINYISKRVQVPDNEVLAGALNVLVRQSAGASTSAGHESAQVLDMKVFKYES